MDIGSLPQSNFDPLEGLLNRPVASQCMLCRLYLQDEKYSRELDPKLQALLSELEAGLGSVMRKKEHSSSGSHSRGAGDGEDTMAGRITD